MPTAHDAILALKQRLGHEQKQIENARNEMQKLAECYNRHIDLVKEMEERRKRVERIAGVLGPHNFEFAELFSDGTQRTRFPVKEIESSADELRKKLALWEAIEQFLTCATEARVGEIQAFLQAVNIVGTTRQAIESAVKTHPKVFRVTKRGGERYISLKSAG